jgi:hypothetical protein
MSALVNHIPVGLDIGGDLGLRRRGQHLTRAVTDDLIQKRSAQAATPFALESLPP